MPQPVQRNLTYHRDGGRMRQFRHIRADYANMQWRSDPDVAPQEVYTGVIHSLDLAVVLPLGRESGPTLQNGGSVKGAGHGLLCTCTVCAPCSAVPGHQGA